jgi:hypothetical protein
MGTMPIQNPLTDFMRQPKIYVRLPSDGRFWPEGSIHIPENRQLPVYSMTAKDEITLKTPDALLNGQAVVDIIQSCFPNIKNAWVAPEIDIDMLLVALRIATYGEMMEISHIVPGTREQVSHQIDLRSILDQLSSADIGSNRIELTDDITCYVKPLTYADLAKASVKTFEAQRMTFLASDSELPEEEKVKIVNQSINTMAETNIDMLVNSIDYIETATDRVDDDEIIRNFLENSDREIYEKIQMHLTMMKNLTTIKPIEFASDPEHIELGAPATYTMPLAMDQSSFFVVNL